MNEKLQNFLDRVPKHLRARTDSLRMEKPKTSLAFSLKRIPDHGIYCQFIRPDYYVDAEGNKIRLY